MEAMVLKSSMWKNFPQHLRWTGVDAVYVPPCRGHIVIKSPTAASEAGLSDLLDLTCERSSFWHSLVLGHENEYSVLLV